jgi:hypothetical protein
MEVLLDLLKAPTGVTPVVPNANMANDVRRDARAREVYPLERWFVDNQTRDRDQHWRIKLGAIYFCTAYKAAESGGVSASLISHLLKLAERHLDTKPTSCKLNR